MSKFKIVGEMNIDDVFESSFDKSKVRGGVMKSIKENKGELKMKFNLGEMAVMEFHGMGAISEEELEIVNIEGDYVYLDDGENDGDDVVNGWKFDINTGKCLNDNTFMGCKRVLKL